MEKQMKNQSSGTRTVFFKLFLVWLLVVNSFGILHAQQNFSTTPAAEIKYIGSADDKLIFQIEYNNEAQKDFTLEIKDQAGFQFYFEKSRDKKFVKKFAIEKAGLGKNAITFQITSQNNVHKQVFDVNASYRLVEEVSVVKL